LRGFRPGSGPKNEVSIYQTAPVALNPVDSQANLVEELIVNARLPGPAWWKVTDADTTVYVLGVPALVPKDKQGPTTRCCGAGWTGPMC
jgi:hypothetical protein